MCCMYIEEESGWTNGSACFYEKSIQWRENSRHEKSEFPRRSAALRNRAGLNGTKSGDREKPIARNATWISLDKIPFSMECNN